MEWNPSLFFQTDSVPKNPFAILILNQPINERAFDAVRRHACYILVADGGANRYYELMKLRSKENTDLPSCILGDLDSIHPSTHAHYASHHVPILHDPDQYSTDFMKSIRFLRVHAHAIISRENPVLSDNHDLYMTSFPTTTAAGGQKSKKLDVVVLGGLGGRVDQGFSQIHHLYTAHIERREMEANYSAGAIGELYLLSEESLSFILPPGKNIIHTPLTHRLDLHAKDDGQADAEDAKWVFSENVGVIPLSGPTVISLTGFEWDVTDWKTEIGGQLSTSNHIRAAQIEVVVDERFGRPVLFTVELARGLKKVER
ncbi:putative thiamine pyrophosphokinase Thi80 [Talaromyces proteolyticus]|uniref:Thiamine pyrophosphokinase n=1 Tax=Talaromyces proteolyticus TaxID=1131652 RepID=A0AAD4Q481_9EURO|nr:putative thiamine pyrophosphokinase Thi80 [Talaromyces proteolyticus]KAH8705894.1 putative thiamine pyrophosphokinase Thi80 [Talaromyces proteolyticus]